MLNIEGVAVSLSVHQLLHFFSAMRATVTTTISAILDDSLQEFLITQLEDEFFKEGRDVTGQDQRIKGNKFGIIKARYILPYLLGSSRLVSFSVDIIFPFISG
jgi:hypothetical protein